MSKLVKLTKGKVATIDDSDFLLVNDYSWQYKKSGRTNGKNGYAYHTFWIEIDGHKVSKALTMHNLIMNPPAGMFVDHINRNGLDNRRSNLRIVTNSQNHSNVLRKNKTGFRGVSFRDNSDRPYEASINFDNKWIYLGAYKTAKEAAVSYNNSATKYFGECAVLNKIT